MNWSRGLIGAITAGAGAGAQLYGQKALQDMKSQADMEKEARVREWRNADASAGEERAFVRAKELDTYKRTADKEDQLQSGKDLETQAGLIAAKRTALPASVESDLDAQMANLNAKLKRGEITEDQATKAAQELTATSISNEKHNITITSKDRVAAAVSLGKAPPTTLAEMDYQEKRDTNANLRMDIQEKFAADRAEKQDAYQAAQLRHQQAMEGNASEATKQRETQSLRAGVSTLMAENRKTIEDLQKSMADATPEKAAVIERQIATYMADNKRYAATLSDQLGIQAPEVKPGAAVDLSQFNRSAKPAEGKGNAPKEATTQATPTVRYSDYDIKGMGKPQLMNLYNSVSSKEQMRIRSLRPNDASALFNQE